jgi:membrane glycosyltransferase
MESIDTPADTESQRSAQEVVLVGTAPPIRRASMTPRPWFGIANALRSALQGQGGGDRVKARASSSADHQPWMAAAKRRRLALLTAVVGSTAAAVWLMVGTEPVEGTEALSLVHVTLFGLLFAWVSAGFFTALMGFVTLMRGDRYQLSTSAAKSGPIDASARTAIIMPICNENIDTVFGGLKATYQSLIESGEASPFDVYVLSDTNKPELRAAELRAWQQLRADLGAAGQRVFYRWRRIRTKRKAGNVADFCRRWGSQYRYMVVLDADSVMSGGCLTSMVRLMEANPKAGIIQTQPHACGHDTLHARAQQFLGRVAGRLFSAGLSYWQLGESHYWGHNAILRVQPFMKHCALAPLPGKGGLSGEILSHDFVEAALIRRAGYEVWLVNLEGSYEQQPPHLIDELQRDRRWCQGNLQNSRLVAEPGFRGVHRAMFVTGAMSYVASPLWLAFMVLGVVQWFMLPAGAAMPTVAPALWIATLSMLLLPRVLGVAWVIGRGEQANFGGSVRLVLASLLEAGLAAVQAPVRMLAHSTFVFVALTGLKLDWKSPSRDESSVSWRDATSRFGKVALGVAALVSLGAWVDPAPMLQLMPLWVPLLLAAPIAVFTSNARLGATLRRNELLLIPEEKHSPALLSHAWVRPDDERHAALPALVRMQPRRRAAPSLVLQAAPRFIGRAAVAMAVVAAAMPLVPSQEPERVIVSWAYRAAMPAPYEDRAVAGVNTLAINASDNGGTLKPKRLVKRPATT